MMPTPESHAGVVVCSKMGGPCLIYETTPSSASQKFRIRIILRSLGYRSFLIHDILYASNSDVRSECLGFPNFFIL
jgi:hypothetical protein